MPYDYNFKKAKSAGQAKTADLAKKAVKDGFKAAKKRGPANVGSTRG